MTSKVKSLGLTIAVNVCRLLLAATFIFSGFVKANDPLGTVYKLEDYIYAMAWFTLPDTFLLGCAVLLALFEFTLGIYILFGIRRKTTSSITVLFMVLMTLMTVYIVIANPVSDCGCFGDVLILSNGATLAKNIVLLAAAILVLRYYRLQKDFLGENIKWLIAFLTLCSIICYAIYCIICLPVFDFRPYKVGTNLREAVVGTSNQQFEVKIIYEKEGQTLELTAEDDDPDSTWTYVETKRISKGDTKKLAATDFYVEDADGEDITEDILLADGYTFLLIIPDLRNADEGCVDKVNEVYDYTQDHDIGFYCLTASSTPRDQQYWNDHTGAEYGYSLAEERMLKTVVRGQPGLVLLKDGIIVKKWSNYNLPDEEELEGEVEN
ncbi:MAG: DoxX family protein [Bacteroidaceae bacterium]|nr:DoxX family protein [Bacteroidaceae bacterium]